ncbi:hypothetical protein AMECASPLE_023249 [Ameca splendens]|uniref:Uncharacterized protein n=1 Tax=Ameca splendens TaxID=208324 RepID=A0ABV0ZDT0_9TELE
MRRTWSTRTLCVQHPPESGQSSPGEHKVYTYDDSESPGGGAVQLKPRPSDTSLLDESPQSTDQSPAPQSEDQSERQKPSRCLSDPGLNGDEEGSSFFLS